MVHDQEDIVLTTVLANTPVTEQLRYPKLKRAHVHRTHAASQYLWARKAPESAENTEELESVTYVREASVQ